MINWRSLFQRIAGWDLFFELVALLALIIGGLALWLWD
jgi:hypothetical protein